MTSAEQNSAYGTVALAYGESRRRVQTKRVNRQKQRCRRAFVLHPDGTAQNTTDRVLSTKRTVVTIRRQNARQGRKTMGLEEKKNGGASKEMPFASANICPGSHSFLYLELDLLPRGTPSKRQLHRHTGRDAGSADSAATAVAILVSRVERSPPSRRAT